MLLPLRQDILNTVLRTVPTGWARPTALDSLEIALLNTMPADDGTGFSEPSGNNYARVTRNPSDANYNISTDIVSNSADITFNVLTGPIGEIVGWATFDGGGTIRWAQDAGDLPVAASVAASNDTFTRASHGFANNQLMRVFALEGLALPGGVSEDTTYHVINVTTDTWQLSTSSGGSAIDITSDGCLNVRRWFGRSFTTDEQPVIPAGLLKFNVVSAST